MAILPIDLQTLYSQLDKVSKNVVYQQQGIQVQNAVMQEKLKQQSIEKNETVRETSLPEDELSEIKEDGSRREKSHKQSQNKQQEPDTDAEENTPHVIRDPSLGSHIDVSG